MENEDMTDLWQRNYGVPGKEQYTAAIDLAQNRVSLTHLPKKSYEELSKKKIFN